MKAVFADTSYYVALLNPQDQHHRKALDATRKKFRIVTTSGVLTELAASMSSPLWRMLFVEFQSTLKVDPTVTVVFTDQASFQSGLDLYAARPDKAWSLVDCISFRVMEEMAMTEALTADHHFQQAGFTALML